MRDEFESLQAERICSETHSWGPLPRVCAHVRRSTAEHSTLVRLVQRLRLMPACACCVGRIDAIATSHFCNGAVTRCRSSRSDCAGIRCGTLR